MEHKRTSPLPCPRCHRPPAVQNEGWGLHVIACSDCFDASSAEPGDPVTPDTEYGSGSLSEAMEEWNDSVLDYRAEHAYRAGDCRPLGQIAKWTDEATGYHCEIRTNSLGCLNGYIEVPEDAVVHGERYERLSMARSEFSKDRMELNYSQPAESGDGWVFGLEFRHPNQLLHRADDEYLQTWNYPRVREAIAWVASQLANLTLMVQL